MTDKLAFYKSKREFKVTSEPADRFRESSRAARMRDVSVGYCPRHRVKSALRSVPVLLGPRVHDGNRVGGDSSSGDRHRAQEQRSVVRVRVIEKIDETRPSRIGGAQLVQTIDIGHSFPGGQIHDGRRGESVLRELVWCQKRGADRSRPGRVGIHLSRERRAAVARVCDDRHHVVR